MKQNKAGAFTRSSYNYDVNGIGQRTDLTTTFDLGGGGLTSNPGDTDWGYDPKGQVVKADHTIPGLNRAYVFDGIGNRLKAAEGTTNPNDPSATLYTPTALNQYESINNQSSIINPQFDVDGNMTSGPLPANLSANSTLGWDAENRLVSASVPGGDTVTFFYDARSRRIAETVGTTTKITIYDGWNPIGEYWRAGLQPASLAKTFTWGLDLSGTMQGAGGVGGLLLITDHSAPGTPSYYPTYDGNGNVSEYLDSSGAVVAHYEYDPFGKTTVATGTKAQDFSHRFSTKPLDAATGLYYYGYRYYDPVTGRWPSRDPIAERGGVNLYGFVYNDPFYWYDYLGGRPKSKGGFTPKSKRSQPTPIGEATLPIRKAIGAAGSVLTGDIFHNPNGIPDYGDSQCKFLLTVSGINMRGDSQKEFHDQVSDLPAYRDIPNSTWGNNPSNFPVGPFGAGDLVQILLNEVLLAVTVADAEMARQIKAAAAKAKENGCCCWSIYVVAHSQGTMVFRRALDLVDEETKKHIHFTGLGGETMFKPDEGLGSAVNITEKEDPVPNLQIINRGRPRIIFDDPDANGGAASHSWRDVYLPYLRETPSLTNGRGDCK